MIYIFHLRRRSGFTRPVPSHYTYVVMANSHEAALQTLERNGWLYPFTVRGYSTSSIWYLICSYLLPIELHRRSMGWFKEDRVLQKRTKGIILKLRK